MIEIITTALPNGTADTLYCATIETSDPATFSVINGTLPPGLTLDSATGTISGIPAIGTYNFDIEAVSLSNTSDTATRNFSIYVEPFLFFTSPCALPIGAVGNYYSQRITTSVTATFSIIEGILPYGLSISSNGHISGIPLLEGDYEFTVRVNANLNPNVINVAKFNIFVVRLSLSFQILPEGTVGVPYPTQYIQNSVGATAFDILFGKLPCGLTLDESTGAISGTPIEKGLFEFVVVAVSADLTQEEFVEVVITIHPHKPCPPPPCPPHPCPPSPCKSSSCSSSPCSSSSSSPCSSPSHSSSPCSSPSKSCNPPEKRSCNWCDDDD